MVKFVKSCRRCDVGVMQPRQTSQVSTLYLLVSCSSPSTLCHGPFEAVAHFSSVSSIPAGQGLIISFALAKCYVRRLLHALSLYDCDFYILLLLDCMPCMVVLLLIEFALIASPRCSLWFLTAGS